jgi:hypothetical protein
MGDVSSERELFLPDGLEIGLEIDFYAKKKGLHF